MERPQREIRAVYTDETIRVYQAYNRTIAEAVKEYVNSWIVKITDITDQVSELYALKEAGKDISGMLPEEKVYDIR